MKRYLILAFSLVFLILAYAVADVWQATLTRSEGLDFSFAVPQAWAQAASGELQTSGRYFTYKGRPMILLGYQAGVSPVPTTNTVSPGTMSAVADVGNHFYLTANPSWVRATWDGLYNTITDDGNWTKLRAIAQAAYDNDVILSVTFWSYKWNYENQDWSGSDLLRNMDNVVVNGMSKRDLIELVAKKSAEATWDLPNVTYNFMWEYNVRVESGDDGDGAIHRWWVDTMRRYGQGVAPGVNHLFSIEYGGEHPSTRKADFMVEEDGNIFLRNSNPLSYGVPLVIWSADWLYEDDVPLTAAQAREQVEKGYNPGQTWVDMTDEAKAYYRSLRGIPPGGGGGGGPSPTPNPTSISTSATPTPSSGGWIYCADEYGFCSFSGTKEVRYGANGSYNYLVLTNGTECTNAVFGDPIKGVGKQCHYRGVANTIRGDINNDKQVNIFDYNLLVENFGNSNCGNIADIDGNCKVDIFDYNILVQNFGKRL